jgi:hypothetical protein
LGFFYLSTIPLSGVYYPTSPLMMHAIIEIVDHLNQFENDDKLREVVVPMKSKFLKYWGTIPLLYSYAFILDPRAKLNGFTKAIQCMCAIVNRDYTTYYRHVKTKIGNLFSKYDVKFDESGCKGHNNHNMEEVRRFVPRIDYLEVDLLLRLHLHLQQHLLLHLHLLLILHYLLVPS